MRHVLTAVDSSDLVALLEQTRLSSEVLAESADKEAAGPQCSYTLAQINHTRIPSLSLNTHVILHARVNEA